MSDRFDEAMASALKYLSKRDRFEAEVRQHLAGFPPDVLEATIDRLRQRRIIDDLRVAGLFVRTKNSLGNLALMTLLAQRGVNEEVAAEAIASADPEELRMEIAVKSKYKSPSDRFRATRFLMSKGFDAELVETMINRIFGEGEPE